MIKFLSYFFFNINNPIIYKIFIFHFTYVHISIQKSSQTFYFIVMWWPTILSYFDLQFSFINFKKWIYSFFFHQYTYLKNKFKIVSHQANLTK